MRPPRSPGPPGSGPRRPRPPAARAPRAIGARSAPADRRAGADAPARASFGRAPGLDELATSPREARRHFPGGRLPKVPGAKAERPTRPLAPPKGDVAPPTGRRARGDVRAAARAAGPSEVEPQRIAKLLARAGVGSRRDIERMIERGLVALRGTVLTTPATIVTSLDGITVEGREVEAIEATRLFPLSQTRGIPDDRARSGRAADHLRRAAAGAATTRARRAARHEHRGFAAAHHRRWVETRARTAR